ncbi:DnaJ family domain-containing protein [Paenibacillus sp. FSL K6-2859]|uniref:DnaJ family domain-containing protein n=1 Tax=Paenibacillus sp. FSL K6-2859 TaxID=2921482 RepID=UPI004046D1DE
MALVNGKGAAYMGMMSWLVEQRIQESMRNGEFRDLPGHGKPLELEDLSGVPEELRMSFKIMKNSGLVPEEVSLRAECVTLEGLLVACHNSGGIETSEGKAIRAKLSLKRLRLQELLRERGLDSNSAFMEYSVQIHEQIIREEE